MRIGAQRDFDGSIRVVFFYTLQRFEFPFSQLERETSHASQIFWNSGTEVDVEEYENKASLEAISVQTPDENCALLEVVFFLSL